MKNFIKEIEVNGVNHNITLGDDMVGSGLKKDENGVVNLDIIKITEEFYDDGSGQVVPIKHPDLSTQPSILPYKFMGQYVYERILPLTQYDDDILYFSFKELPFKDSKDVVFIEADVLGVGDVIVNAPATINYNAGMFGTVGVCSEELKGILSSNAIFDVKYYVRIVYTQMPKEGDYYGYNNY